ncbi:MAG: PilZ domain-containing protein [Alphaproteobacteria bacterium]|nr:PilZ domain-containing protein [Alphaproteobacteria bacterium]
MVDVIGKISDILGSTKRPRRDLGDGDRREYERYSSDKTCSVQFGDTQVESQLLDISVTGAWIESKIDAAAGTEVDVVIFSLDRSFDAEIIRVDDSGTHIQFLIDEEDSEALELLETFVVLTKVEHGDTLE